MPVKHFYCLDVIIQKYSLELGQKEKMQKPLLLIFRGILPGRIQARDLFILNNFHPTKIFVCCGVQFSMIFCHLSQQISIFSGLINLTFLVISVIVISKFSPTMGTIYNDFWSFVTQVPFKRIYLRDCIPLGVTSSPCYIPRRKSAIVLISAKLNPLEAIKRQTVNKSK